MLARLRRFLALPHRQRIVALRRRWDFLRGAIIFGGPATRLNRSQRFAYLSYVPDSIREFGRFPYLRDVIGAWISGNARRNGGDLPRMLMLMFNAGQVMTDEVEGDFAELGVYKGNSAKVLANLIALDSTGRRLHLFDTFGGFDQRDLAGLDAGQAVLFDDVTLEQVRAFVGHQGICEYWVGYFPESATEIPGDAKFAFVHLDLDLYAPMKAGLEFFYPRMSPGAMMVLHDYSSGHWPGTTAAVDEFLSDKPEAVVLMPDKSGTAVFRKL